MLVAVSGRLSSSWQALDWAAAEASSRQCVLRILHVVQWPVSTSDVFGGVTVPIWNEQLEAAASETVLAATSRARTVDPRVEISTQVRFGRPAAVLLGHADPDSLIVLGQRHERLGRTARRVVRYARPPVAVVRLDDQGTRGPAAGRVVLVPSRRASSTATGAAFRAALRRQVGLTVLHDKPRQLEADYSRQFPEIDVDHRPLPDPGAHRILAEAAGAALLVLDGTGRAHRARAMVGLAGGPAVLVGHANRDDRRHRRSHAEHAVVRQ